MEMLDRIYFKWTKNSRGISTMEPNDVIEKELKMIYYYEKERKWGNWRLWTITPMLKSVGYQRGQV